MDVFTPGPTHGRYAPPVGWVETFRERQRGRFGLVLIATFGTIVVVATAPQTRWSAIVLVAMQGGTLWLAFVAAGATRRVVEIGLGVWILAAIVTGFAASDRGDGAIVPIVSLLLIASAAGAILRSLVARGRITMSSVGGVLAVYLLIGLFFTYVYATIGAIGDTPPLRGEGPIDLSAQLYFTYITMATVGYGDLVPATDLVRGVAIAEALIGQLYLVSVVALVVGNLGRETGGRQRSSDDDAT